jgi:hypothetical protein
MNMTSGKDFLTDLVPDTDELIRHYTILQELCAEVEKVSQELIKTIKESSPSLIIRKKLTEKMDLADRITKEAKIISAMKKILLERENFSEDDRLKVRKSEQLLTVAVGRIVEQENKCREIVMQVGIKVSKR